MSPETRRQYKDDLARLRYDRARYRRMSSQRRKEATECRRKRDFLGALQKMDRCHEYARYAAQFDAEAKRITAQTGIR